MKKFALCAAVTLLVCAPGFGAIPASERNALLALYNSAGGPNWAFNSGWGGPAGTECNWSDVTCDDAQTTVTQLYLGARGLLGTIPPQIGDLTNLTQLNLSNNALNGPIPTEIGKLTKLQTLDLNNNQLTGPIPTTLGSLTALTELDVDTNQLSGTIPPQLGSLTQLQVLNLSDNRLTGTIPVELTHLSNLTYLDLSYAQLSGPLPEFSGWPALAYLSFSVNQLSGPIPASVGQLASIEQLSLDTNQLTGPIPPQIGNLTKLTYLGLSVNQQMSGTIPPQIGNLSQLTQLLLAYDGLSGTIPDSIYTLRQLTNLGLEGNQLTGPISPAIGNLVALTQLDLNTNQLSGPIPAEITGLPALTELDLQENALTGAIPASLDRLTNLVTLDLGSNQLTGGIPASIGNLKKLETLALYDNHLGGALPDSLRNIPNLMNITLAADDLTGSIPDWLFQFPKIDSVYLSYNALTGPLPSTISSATTLEIVDLSGNQLTGSLPSDFGRLQKLSNLSLAYNEISGPIPDSFWTIATLSYVDVSSNQLSGPLPAAIGNLKSVRVLNFEDNRLSGVLPPEIGSLANLDLLSLGSNEFTGTLPRELGQLKKVEAIDFSANNFRSPVPPEIAGMTALVDGGVDFAYNALSVTDPTLIAFMNRVQFDHDFAHSQTVMPAGITVGQMTDRSAVISWTPIRYTWDEGGYRVFASTTPGGAPAVVATTGTKEVGSITVRGLQPSTTYYFTVAAVTHPHDFQHNLIVSDVSAPVSGTTTAKQLAPADVVLTATPNGLIELDGVPQNQDSFTLTNFGDVATNITLTPYDADFYDFTPKQFTLGAGASQIVIVTAIPNQPPGVRYGGIVPGGDGTSDDDIVTTTLLSAARSGGNAVAVPLTNRIELTADPGTDPVGQVAFRNVGTAELTGIIVADVPWLVLTNPAPITIEPTGTATVSFKSLRARRPAGISGALTGTLSLIYVAAIPGSESAVHASDTTPPAGISISKVTVVDVTKPDVSSATAPGLGSGEVAYFIAGLLDRSGTSSTLASSLQIVNAFGSQPITDVRLYYTSASEKAIATLGSLDSSQGVALANVVGNVYSPTDQIGSVQVRSADWQSLVVNAGFLRSTGSGTLLGDMPVFRSDRALAANDKLYLTGIAQSSTVHAAAVLEEISGTPATVSMDFLDASGAVVQHRDVPVAALATTEVTDVPAGAKTIVVTNATTATPTGVLAYVRMSDDTSGDTWSVVDWSRALKYLRTETVRLPLVMGGGGGGKRRAVKQSDAVRATTSASLFNSGTSAALARVSSGPASKEISIAPRQTVTIADVGAFLGTTTAESVAIEPVRGEFVVSSRIDSGGTGTAVPAVPSQNGLRTGQSQVFSGLEDSAAYRTDYGFVETGGAATTIRATLLLSDARSLFTTIVSRDFQLAPGSFVYVSELVKSILGSTRSSYGDLHNLQLQLEIVDGSGSILPFVTTTDTATGDTVLRLE